MSTCVSRGLRAVWLLIRLGVASVAMVVFAIILTLTDGFGTRSCHTWSFCNDSAYYLMFSDERYGWISVSWKETGPFPKDVPSEYRDRFKEMMSEIVPLPFGEYEARSGPPYAVRLIFSRININASRGTWRAIGWPCAAVLFEMDPVPVSSSGVSQKTWRRWVTITATRFLPIGLVADLAGATITVVVAEVFFKTSVRRLRRRRGECEDCGFDLSGTSVAICPECGSTVCEKADT